MISQVKIAGKQPAVPGFQIYRMVFAVTGGVNRNKAAAAGIDAVGKGGSRNAIRFFPHQALVGENFKTSVHFFWCGVSEKTITWRLNPGSCQPHPYNHKHLHNAMLQNIWEPSHLEN